MEENIDQLIDFFATIWEFILGVLVSLVGTIIWHRYQRRNFFRGIMDQSFFEFFHEIGSSRPLDMKHFKCYFINPINERLVESSLVLKKVSAKSNNLVDSLYTAEYHSCDADGNEKIYYGKASVKTNVLNIYLVEKKTGVAIFMMANQLAVDIGTYISMLHTCPDQNNRIVSGNRLMKKVESDGCQLSARFIEGGDSDEEIKTIRNYLTLFELSIHTYQIEIKSKIGIDELIKDRIDQLNINVLDQLVGTWVSFSKVYKDDITRYFVWTIKRNGKEFEVTRQGDEGTYYGTVKADNMFISFLLTQEGLKKEIITLKPTGKRKHLLAHNEGDKDCIKGLTTTWVHEDGIYIVASREIMVKTSGKVHSFSEILKKDLLTEKRNKLFEPKEMKKILLLHGIDKEKVEGHLRHTVSFLDQKDKRIHLKNTDKNGVLSGNFYVYFFNLKTQKIERFSLEIDLGSVLVAHQIKSRDRSRMSYYKGSVIYEDGRLLMMTALYEREKNPKKSPRPPISINIQRKDRYTGFLTSYDYRDDPIAIKVLLEKNENVSIPPSFDFSLDEKEYIRSFLQGTKEKEEKKIPK